MSTTSVGGNYVIDPSQSLSLAGDSGIPVYTINGYAQFTDRGSIQITSSAANAYVTAFADNEGSPTVPSQITIAQGGSFTVSATGSGSSAYGLYTGSWSASFENDGAFSVSAAAVGVGLAPWGNGAFVNTGSFNVTAADATGLSAQYASTYSNSGQIDVNGLTKAIAFNLHDAESGFFSFFNQGDITATATSGSAYGLYLGGTYNYTPLTIINSGTITAQHAIYEVSNVGPNQTPALHIINSGIINGDVDLSVGPYSNYTYTRPAYDSEILNSGAINGNIHLSQNGNDLYNGVGGTLTGVLYLGGGLDTVTLGNDGETVHGGAGAARVTGGAGADTFVGGAGADVVDGGGGDDNLDGGGGINSLSFASATLAGVTVNLGLTSAQVTGVGNVTLAHFQNLTGSTHADVLTGDAFDNVMDGNGGDDTIDGGGGTDTISFASAATGVTVSLALQGQVQTTGVGSVVLLNFENLTGSAGSDHLTGDAGDNVLDGGSGGNDVLDGGGGTNTVSFASQTSGVTVSLARQGALQSVGTGTVNLTHFQNLIGSAYSDTLTGDANDNVVDGGGGNDVLDGGGGTNTVSFASASSGIAVSLALQGRAQTTGVGTDTITNFQNVIGSAGNDTLQGDSGNNVLAGGGGADTFVVTPNGGADTITDFSDAEGDRIDVSGFYKYTDLAQVLTLATQSGPDTLIDFGGGTTLTLKNVTRDNLSSSDFVFTTVIKAGAGTITTDPSLVLNATSGALVQFTSTSGGTLINRGSLTSTGSYAGALVDGLARTAIFQNDGTFSVTGTAPLAINNVTLHNNGTFSVTATSTAWVHPITGDVVNAGSMVIRGAGQVYGVQNWTPDGLFHNLAGGTFSVTGGDMYVMGVAMPNGCDVENDGVVTVSGTANPVGFSLTAYSFAANHITNSGSIRVIGTNSVGIAVGGYGPASVTLDNSGAITATTALSFGVAANITNSGSLNGDVTLSSGSDTLLNTGTVGGALNMGNGDDTLDSRLGTITGLLTLGSGSSTASLGGEDNIISLAAGTHVVDAGGGTNTVSYASAGAGVRVSLALQGEAQSTGVGTDTLSNIQALIGSSYNDILTAGSGTSTLTGGLGADTFKVLPGSTAVTITDFSHTQGDRINLSGLYEFTSLSEVLAQATQSDATTVVINLGAGESLTLQNAILANLTGADFVLTSTPIEVGATAITTNPSLNLSIATAGPLASFTGTGGALDNKGSMSLNLPGSWAIGVGTVIGLDPTGVFTNDGSFSVSGNQATGVSSGIGLVNAGTIDVVGTDFAYGAEGEVRNSGAITVSSQGQAYGDYKLSLGSFDNSGTFSVTSSGGQAVGVYMGHGPFTNTGQMTISGGQPGSIAVYVSPDDGVGSIDNGPNATITASAASSSIGIEILTSGQGTFEINNAGTVTATSALYYAGTSVHIINTGTFNGQVTLFSGTDILDSHAGTINGLIELTSVTSTQINLGVEDNAVNVDTGWNTIDGGGGTNRISYVDGGTGVTVSLALQGQAQSTGLSTDTLSNFQNLTGSAFNDTLEGDGANNVLDGGAGTNTVSYAHAASGVAVSLALQGTAQNTLGAGSDTLSNFQNLTGSAFSDVLEGDASSNVLNGAGGTNTVSYAHAAAGVTVSLSLQGSAQNTLGAGTDTLYDFQNLTGSAFNDVLEGDSGDNVLDGAGGSNTVSYAHAAAGVTASLALQGSAQNTFGAGIDTLSNFQNLSGSAFDDILEGNGNNNVLNGAAGTNTVSYAHAASGVTVNLALQGQGQNTVGAGTDTLSNFQNIRGSAFADHLSGDGGDNIIDGGGGKDVLTGGAGADTFVYRSGDGNVTVTDFSDAQGDKVDLSGLFHTFGQVAAAAAQVGSDVVIATPGGGSLTLDGLAVSSLAASDFTGLTTITGDFLGTGHASLFWQNSVNNLTSAWLLTDAAPASGVSLPAVTGWQTYDVGNFSGGAYGGDFLLRNSTTGMVDVWQDNAGTMSGHDVASATLDWQIMGTADFNGDGKSDILWRNEQNGYVSVWQMDGTSVSTTYNPGVVGLQWKLVAANDFYGDGRAEVLWRDPGTGEVNLWTIDGPGAGQTHGQTVAHLGAEWKVAGTGDFNGDGRADILWFDTVTGQVVLWEMNGPTVTAAEPIGDPGPQWRVVNVADISGDGKADILWRDTGTGQVVAWAMNGFNVDHYGVLATVDNTWKVINHNYDWA